jgi:chemotaxis signal transduction protein
LREITIRYFICALGEISLGIPAEQTERIISISRKQAAVHETENGEAFISLPALLNLDVPAPHGVVLKNPSADACKTMLLAPRIDSDQEIPEENIQQLPKAISGLFRYLRGVYFDDSDAVFILSPDKLAEYMR